VALDAVPARGRRGGARLADRGDEVRRGAGAGVVRAGGRLAFEPRLAALYPGNNNVRPKIRQQLQVLRDRGWLEFLGRGRYRVRPSAV
jgi:Dam-replacing HTH domain